MATHFIKYTIEVTATDMDGTPEESAEVIGEEIFGTIEEFMALDNFKIVAVEFYDINDR